MRHLALAYPSMISITPLRRKLATLMSVLLACSFMTGCQHSESPAPQKSSRGMQARLLKPDMNKGNPFEKQFNTASAGDRGAMKSFGSKSYRTSDVNGLKSYSGVKSFKTGEYSQAGKLSRMGSATSSFASKDSRMGSKAFATKDSKFGGMTARQDNQSFRDGNSVYKTAEFEPARKSLDDNKRIYIEAGERDPSKNANAYAEDDVKRLLGR